MRVSWLHNPFPTMPIPGYFWADCPAHWVWYPSPHDADISIVAFRLPFRISTACAVRLHASADQRYELFLDGERLGRGPERGDLAHWFFDTYELSLAPGDHLLAARAWWLGGSGAPMAQMSGAPGFLLLAEGELSSVLSTGSGAWQALAIEAYSEEPCQVTGYHVVGWSFALDGHHYPWGWETDPTAAGTWAPAVAVRPAIGGESNPYANVERATRVPDEHLTPAMLPAMMEVSRQLGRVRHAERGQDGAFASLVLADRHDPELAEACERLLLGKGSLSVKAGQSVRVIIDLEDYYCAYPELVTSGGRDAQITIAWAESLFTEEDASSILKGDRNQVAGKHFRGFRDRFILDGGARRRYDTLWWRAGRYVEIVVQAASEPLTVEGLRWRETRYPLEMEGSFEASDPRLAEAVPIMHRTLQMCAHETYMDCPYYEQLMYVGDGRLEVLATYLTAFDSRLPIKAISLFDRSRAPDGLTKSRYPSAIPQVIPPFSLWWVGMVHDYFLWRDDPARVRGWLPGVDAVLAGFERYLSADLVAGIRGWNFCDWVPEWNAGWPPDGRDGASALINLQYVYALDRAAEMHDAYDEPGLAHHWRAIAARVRRAIVSTFWDEARGLLADDAAHTAYSEHVQVLAILTDLLQGKRRQRMIEGLLSQPDLARATIYFSHYLFEALWMVGAVDRILDGMALWFELPAGGFVTTLESPEPSRSDCHAWGAHPLYHYYATFLGARPSLPGFREIRIAPQPGPLTWLKGAFPHPSGEKVVFDLRFDGSALRGEIALPRGLRGTLVWQGQTWALGPGTNRLP